MAGVVILSNAGAMMTFANNHEDHLYEGYAGDGSDVPTLIRPKTDRTSAYAKNLNTNLTHRIEVAGTHATSGHGNVFGFDNCTEGTQWGYYDLKPGTYQYRRNTVYEQGYRYAYLVLTVFNSQARSRTLVTSIRKKVSLLKMKNIIKISVISVIAIVLLLSIGKNLNLTAGNNLLAEFINNVFRNEEKDRENITADSTEIVNNADDTAASINTENKDKLSSTTNNEQNRIFEGISKDWYGTKVIMQNDNIVSKYYKFTIHNTSTSKKLGDFNYSDNL